MKNKYLYSIIAVLVVVLCFMSFSLYQTKKQAEQAFGIFLNHFYFTIDRMVEGFVEMIDNNEDTDTLAFYLNRLHEDMQNANHLFYSNAFINEDMYYYFYFKNLDFMVNGLTSSTNNQDPIRVAPFLEDGKLDDVEVAVLEWVKQDLEQIRQGLYSEETRQEDPKITIDTFNEITTSLIMKDYSDMANRYHYEQRQAEKISKGQGNPPLPFVFTSHMLTLQ